MSIDNEPTTIDSLLKGSQWEERVAHARIRRERVLAAKANHIPAGEITGPTPAEVEAFAPRKTPPSPATQPRSGNIVMVLAGGIAIGAAVSGVAVWAF